MRVALLTEIPAPYRVPLFNALADRVDLDVLYLRERNPDRGYYRLREDEQRFRWRVVPGRDLTVGGRWLILSRGVGRALREIRPDVILLGGWNQPAFWAAALYARRRGSPFLIWVENTLREAGTRGPKRVLARAADAFVVPGQSSQEYVRAVRPDDSVAVAPNAVDAELFASRLADRERLRAEYGLVRTTVLYVGRLAPEKGVDVLLDAVRDLDADVLVAGTGPKEAELRTAAPTNVRFLGEVEQDRIPALYAVADVLCLPSRREPWGMTLNEGAAAGLALVASCSAGGAADLVVDGVNGFRVPPDDASALREALRRLCEDETLRASAGARSREIAARFTPDAWAEAVAEVAARVADR